MRHGPWQETREDLNSVGEVIGWFRERRLARGMIEQRKRNRPGARWETVAVYSAGA